MRLPEAEIHIFNILEIPGGEKRKAQGWLVLEVAVFCTEKAFQGRPRG